MRKPSPQLLDLLAECSPGVTRLALALRELVLTEAPDAEEVLYSVYAQVIVFKLSGRKPAAFCNVAAYERHVNLVFYYGALLLDPHGVLRGTGKKMRYIRFDSPDDVRHSATGGRGLLTWSRNTCHGLPLWRGVPKRYLRNYIRSAIGKE